MWVIFLASTAGLTFENEKKNWCEKIINNDKSREEVVYLLLFFFLQFWGFVHLYAIDLSP